MGGKIVHQAPGTGWCMLGYLWRFEEVVQQVVCCCRVQGQLSTVQFLQDFGHAICPQVYLYKMRKPELPVVERCCLNKHRGCHFLVEIFWLLGFFFFPQVINLGSIYLFFSSLRTSPLIFQPSSAVFSHAQVPHSGDSKAPKANITLRVISTSHSQADTGSPPWRDDPLLQNYNSLCLSCCSLFFGGYLSPAQASLRLAELTVTEELPSPIGSVFGKLCPWLQPHAQSVLRLHPFSPPRETSELSQTIKARNSVWTIKALPLKK